MTQVSVPHNVTEQFRVYIVPIVIKVLWNYRDVQCICAGYSGVSANSNTKNVGSVPAIGQGAKCFFTIAFRWPNLRPYSKFMSVRVF